MEKGSSSKRVGYEAIVVGSGYGGAIAACRLAQAGVNVCVLEKGKRWDPHQFPTTTREFLRNMSFKTPCGSFGAKQGLYEVHSFGDSIALIGTGLGGGSLVNAGVILPTPIRARRDGRWPKEWNHDWEMHEARSHAILEPEAMPFQAPKSRVMELVQDQIEGAVKDDLKLTVSFGNKKKNPANVSQNECISCGNCLSGCTYNAKKSLDRNYLELAAQSGAAICTGVEVLFITQELVGDCFGCFSCNPKLKCLECRSRRWRVYLNEVDYISADYVILAAGVLGTTGILLRSSERGLQVSSKLGYGVSSNGNNVALVADTKAKTQAHGLAENDFSHTPLNLRPGPVISSSYTSSLGFTIQSSNIPNTAPEFVLKGFITYSLSGYGIITSMWKHMKQRMGTEKAQALVLNMMGYDSADGRITLDERSGRVIYKAAQDLLLPGKVRTAQKLAKRLQGELYMSRFRSIAVHLLGGCNAAEDSSLGVANPNGQVFSPVSREGKLENTRTELVHQGLYICDASLIPCPVGVNPINAISTVAERVASRVVADAVENLQTELDQSGEPKCEANMYLNPRRVSQKENPQVIIHESLSGELGGLPCTLNLVLHMGQGQNEAVGRRSFGDPHSLLQGFVGGKLLLPSVEPSPLHIIDGFVDMCWVDERAPYTQLMHYHLLLSTSKGTRYILDGKKKMRPYLSGMWLYKESTTLEVVLRPQLPGSGKNPVELQGKLKVSLPGLIKSLITLKGPGRLEFLGRLVETMARTYWMRVPRTPTLKLEPGVPQDKYPDHVLHQLITGDGVKITCKQWCSGEQNLKVVLLLNGYSAESYCLPKTEHDIIRTLLENDFEPWILQTRLHPSHPCSTPFDFDDIARYDIPAVFEKIRLVKKQHVPVHVIAHCIGGLAIHMSLMGGYVPSSSVASVVCTNSSMFFCLVPSALVKLNLPLIPISMKLLGDKHIIPISTLENKTIMWRHRVLRSMLRFIPRTESCTCDECNLYSGVFGTPFWHENVHPETHDWLNKESIPVLPLSAFPHLRKICLRQHAVDSRGRDVYLSHPERVGVHTTYISGGEELLLTKQTSLRAHEFMRRHQPGFDHARFVVPGYGHSDLWIGENSHRDVFPIVLDRLRNGGRSSDAEENIRRNVVLPWETQEIFKSERGTSGLFIALTCILILVLIFIRFSKTLNLIFI